ncbi:poly-gamma-glutamate synthesis protein (capsule biosynthesis protein) [Micromonospora pisi]|uniref:Poly-gamma-glutamate synthesis protein (Capsule biosynthesis protein) n=1 Tax=Micromonospora pisi TaxID=589240 RepID=A0A495JP21_9ACTN|nr:CapA family protein [Micromonospora pisi]RKR89789.1 poly-gamma-glutamate synthesis protein (capsule biosynthesis protein) [Micromonospora pisi]
MLLFSVVLAGALIVIGGIGYRADWWGESPRSSSWVDPSGGEPSGSQPPGGGTAGAPPGTRLDAQGRRLLTVLGAGDVLIHPEVTEQAKRDAARTGQAGGYDFFPMFERVAPAISGADLAICHLETPLAPAAGPFEGYPRFSAPPQVVDGLRRAGFDACSTASNHTMDQGAQGVKRTLDALDAAGLGHAGSARDAAEANTPRIYEAAGVKVGHLSYTLNFNGLERPAGKLWMANLIEPAKILAAAKKLRAAGAEIVVLSLHWGTEYQHLPDADQLDWVKPLIESPDINLVLGHHAHVVQPFEEFDDKWVVYGMGNQIARHADPVNDNREGVMARITFTEMAPKEWKITEAAAIPIWTDISPDIRLVDLAAALANPALAADRRKVYQGAYQRITGYLTARGADQDGLKVLAPTG